MSVSGVGGVSPMIMSGASMRMPPQQKMANLFSQIDTAGAGSINKAQFDQAFKVLNPPVPFKLAGPEAVFAQLDPNNTGKVSRDDFIKGMQSLMVSLRSKPSGA